MTSRSGISKFIPLIDSLRTYSTSRWRGDLNAGIMVGIMLIPQGMAYAVLAGLPPVYGLYAAIVPLLLYALFGTSRQLAVGPVAMISLLVVAGLSEFAEAGSDRFIQLAILTAFGVGLFQLLMGIFRMGFLVNFFSHPVLSGFTSAAALIIAVSQAGSLLGITIDRALQVHESAFYLLDNIGQVHPSTALIGVGSILTILLLKQVHRAIPGMLIVVMIGTAVTAFWGLDTKGVAIVGHIPEGFPLPGVDSFNLSDLRMLFPIILVISLVSYMESIAVAKVIATKRGYRVNPNQELVALGIANIGGSLFKAFPTTGGFSRTAVNDQSGARTGVASIISALLVALTLLFLTPLFYHLPTAVLAAIIIVAVASLFDSKEILNLWKTDRKDLAMWLATFTATLGAGIVEGILVGVVLSLVTVIYSSTRPHSAELGRLGQTQNFRNVKRYSQAGIDENILIFRFDAQLFFANAERFRETLEELIMKKGEKLELVILDASAISSIDSTGVHTLKELIRDLKMRRIGFSVAGAIGPLRDKLKSCGITEAMGEESFFFDVANAVAHFKQYGPGKPKSQRDHSPCQTNI